MFEGDFNIRVQPEYESNENREMLLKRLSQIGSNIRFEADKWVCDTRVKSAGQVMSDYTLYFASIPVKYKELFKYFILIRLGSVGVRTLNASLTYYKHLFNFLDESKNYLSLKDVDKKFVKDFELYIYNLNLAKSTKESIWSCSKIFFDSLSGWGELPKKNPFGAINPFKRTRKDYKSDDKYVPELVTNQLDNLFKDKSISIHERLVYWLLRAIPSRISEITGMKIDCLKPSYDNKLVLFIPTWKQNGGHMQPELRSIYLNPEGELEKFLIEMIKQQQQIALSLQDKVKTKGYLFTYQNPREKKGEKAFLILNRRIIQDSFNSICKKKNVKDDEGNDFRLTPHQLRHNGITDRIEAGFSFIEIRDMTNHKGNSMIWNTYYHPRKEVTLSRQKKLLKLSKNNNETKKPIYFKGRILNLDTHIEERILKNPRAYRIMEGEHSIGICSDVTGCRSSMFECLDCEYFVVNAGDLEYFKKQVSAWKIKVEQFNGRKQALENAQHNLKLHKSIVERIEMQVELLKEENK